MLISLVISTKNLPELPITRKIEVLKLSILLLITKSTFYCSAIQLLKYGLTKRLSAIQTKWRFITRSLLLGQYNQYAEDLPESRGVADQDRCTRHWQLDLVERGVEPG